ncbi:DUF4249 domain-containing protein [Flammeovirga pectinis]|uniref:DUF4249 domain-containing protein n=2 Tax=Flammeovirga pectinis TaxID=2494373 RepID=A0A3Q9FKJ1_9BACT|nr:DUF4249 domain-containing protein [Flammeovirga pectinis]
MVIKMTFKNIQYIIYFFIFTLISCEDVITVDLATGRPQIVVDGWINNKFETQKIRLVSTTGYFNSDAPPYVENATVKIHNLVNNTTMDFTYDKDGYYTWTPATLADTLLVRQRPSDFDRDSDGLYNNYYRLEVTAEFTGVDVHFEAFTSLERTPVIDSLTFKTQVASDDYPEVIYGELWAKDFAGPADCYWIKTWKNDSLLNKSNEMSLAFDITPGRSDYGDVIKEDTYFIPPVRNSINPRLSDDEQEAKKPLYQINDSVYCEIHSMTENAFDFMSQAKSQMSNGGLFATPLANVPSNILALDSKSDGLVVGVFCGSAISSKGFRIKTKPPYEEK